MQFAGNSKFKNIMDSQRTKTGLLLAACFVLPCVILLAVFAVINVGGTSLGDIINISGKVNLGNIGGIVFFVILTATLWKAIVGKKGNK